MNPIALLSIVLGLALIALGMFWVRRRARLAGDVSVAAGLALVVLPFVVSLFLTF